MIVTAIVEKLVTDDGLVALAHADVGKTYAVILESVRFDQLLIHWHPPADGEGPCAPIVHRKDLIWTEDGQWLPLALLRIEGPVPRPLLP